MGAWGTRPDENDGSGDLFDRHVGDVLDASLGRLFRSQNVNADRRWERVGVVYRLMREWPKNVLPGDVLKTALHDLQALYDDVEWQQSWDDPRAIRKSIVKVMTIVDDAERGR